MEGKHSSPIDPHTQSSFAQQYVLSPYCIVFDVGLLQSNLHYHLVRKVSSSRFNYILSVSCAVYGLCDQFQLRDA